MHGRLAAARWPVAGSRKLAVGGLCACPSVLLAAGVCMGIRLAVCKGMSCRRQRAHNTLMKSRHWAPLQQVCDVTVCWYLLGEDWLAEREDNETEWGISPYY